MQRAVELSKSVTSLQIVDTNVGTGAEADAWPAVRVHYTGTLMDGTKFDSSKDPGSRSSSCSGRRSVIPGGTRASKACGWAASGSS